MRQTLGVLAVVMISLISGCAATGAQTSTGSQGSGVLAAAAPAPNCTGGWHACVCDKEAKCCAFRQDCECGSSGQAICK